MPLYKLVEYNDNNSRRSGNFWQYYRKEPPLNNFGAIADFVDNNSQKLSSVKLYNQEGFLVDFLVH